MKYTFVEFAAWYKNALVNHLIGKLLKEKNPKRINKLARLLEKLSPIEDEPNGEEK